MSTERAIEIAEKLLSSNECYLDNVLELWRIGNKLHGECWDTAFRVFAVIETESDHLPIAKVRKFCSSDFLIASDIELEEIIDTYKDDVTKACKSIIDLYS